jgi:hypothetical protein
MYMLHIRLFFFIGYSRGIQSAWQPTKVIVMYSWVQAMLGGSFSKVPRTPAASSVQCCRLASLVVGWHGESSKGWQQLDAVLDSTKQLLKVIQTYFRCLQQL